MQDIRQFGGFGFGRPFFGGFGRPFFGRPFFPGFLGGFALGALLARPRPYPYYPYPYPYYPYPYPYYPYPYPY